MLCVEMCIAVVYVIYDIDGLSKPFLISEEIQNQPCFPHALLHLGRQTAWYSRGCNFIKKLKSPAFVRGSLGKWSPKPSTGLDCEEPRSFLCISVVLLGLQPKLLFSLK